MASSNRVIREDCYGLTYIEGFNPRSKGKGVHPSFLQEADFPAGSQGEPPFPAERGFFVQKRHFCRYAFFVLPLWGAP